MTLYVYHDFEHSELETLLNQALGPELIEIQELYYDQGRKWCLVLLVSFYLAKTSTFSRNVPNAWRNHKSA